MRFGETDRLAAREPGEKRVKHCVSRWYDWKMPFVPHVT
jgi:hypothetical protein